MCLANDFAALSAPCVKCVRVRPHILTFPFHFLFLNFKVWFPQFFEVYFEIRIFHFVWLSTCAQRLSDSLVCRYNLTSSSSFCPSCSSTMTSLQRCTAVCLCGICASPAAFSLAGRHRAGIPSRVHWQCSSGSLLTAPLITQGHNHRPLWSNSQFAASPPFNRTASTQAGAASRPQQM